MPVIEPDLKSLMGEGLLNDDVRVAIMIDVESADCNVRFRRLEADVGIVATREV